MSNDVFYEKPALTLDFDGVCHSYKRGWEGIDVINDGPVAGLFEFIENASEHFQVCIFSSRSREEKGIQAMAQWFVTHSFLAGKPHIIGLLAFPKVKPPAVVSIDDRAITFTGSWPDIEFLRSFKPWNKKET